MGCAQSALFGLLEPSIRGQGDLPVQKLLASCAVTALSTIISGCGGGASTTPPALPVAPLTVPPPATTVTAYNFNTQEYEFSTSAKFSNAIGAWQAGATGKGVKIGIIDSGIYPDNPEFAGKIDPASRDLSGSGSIQDSWGHGTALASIAAAARDNSYLEGVAPDATLVVMKVANCDCSYDTSKIASGIDAAVAAGAKVINLSIGGDASSDVVDAVRRAAQSGVVFVISAGNDGNASPTGFAMSIASAADGRAIIVGALGNPTGEPIDYYRGTGIDYNQQWTGSNGAGSFAGWFLNAPGFGVRVAYQNDGVDVVRGTSFAAPAVAGAVALLLQAFPNLTSQEVVQILLTTADDLGQTGTDSVYGRGRLDVGRAFQPIGQTALAGSSKTATSTVNNGSAPSAVGDSLQRGSLHAIVLDAYRRAYDVNLARTLQAAAGQRPLNNALTVGPQDVSLSAGPFHLNGIMYDGSVAMKLGFASSGVGPTSQSARIGDILLVTKLGRNNLIGISSGNGASSLVRRLDGSGPRSFFVSQDVLSNVSFNGQGGKSVAFRRAMGRFGVSGSYEKGEIAKSYVGDREARYLLTTLGTDTSISRLNFGIRLSRLDEANSVLGGRLGPVFGASGAKTFFLDAEARNELGNGWALMGQARRGWTKFAGGAFTTGSYSLGLDKSGVWRSNDYLSFLLTQPLRADGGGFALSLPGTYDYETASAAYSLAQMSLTPKGREIVSELAYTRPLSFGSAGFNIYARRQPGHYASAGPDVGAAVHFRIKL